MDSCTYRGCHDHTARLSGVTFVGDSIARQLYASMTCRHFPESSKHNNIYGRLKEVADRHRSGRNCSSDVCYVFNPFLAPDLIPLTSRRVIISIGPWFYDEMAYVKTVRAFFESVRNHQRYVFLSHVPQHWRTFPKKSQWSHDSTCPPSRMEYTGPLPWLVRSTNTMMRHSFPHVFTIPLFDIAMPWPHPGNGDCTHLCGNRTQWNEIHDAILNSVTEIP